ncbi:unnamed protein product [Rotaria socialis]|nr:unnamed protein product [Rotaria socialis]
MIIMGIVGTIFIGVVGGKSYYCHDCFLILFHRCRIAFMLLDFYNNKFLNVNIALFLSLAYVYTNYKAVAPAFPSIDVGGTTTPSVKDELPKVSAAPITTPIEEKVTTKRPRRRRKKTTITPNPAGSTVVSTNKSDESNNGQDTSKTVLKRIIRSLIQ